MTLKSLFCGLAAAALCSTALVADPYQSAVEADYDAHLGALFTHFHENPELSFQEHQTAARLAGELEAAGFEVHTGIGQTGLLAIMKNGDGPTVMMRADMDGLPVEEKSGLSYASKATQEDPFGVMQPVMHACGHDVHITSLVGTARQMAANKDKWSGTLMLLGQPAEERGGGARVMREDGLYERFGMPDMAFAFHVSAGIEAGKLYVTNQSAYAGVDSVDIIIHGVGGHGASPHATRDPIVIGAHIVTALQTLVSRNLAPRRPGVVTVGSFHSGSKHNIISDYAKLQLTVRSDEPETRALLLTGIERIAKHTALALGVSEDKLPEVVRILADVYPPTRNDPELADRVRSTWLKDFDADMIVDHEQLGMGAEDFPFLVTTLDSYEPLIPSVYFAVGGTPKEDLATAPSHHSPLFKIAPRESVTAGTRATVSILMDVMGR